MYVLEVNERTDGRTALWSNWSNGNDRRIVIINQFCVTIRRQSLRASELTDSLDPRNAATLVGLRRLQTTNKMIYLSIDTMATLTTDSHLHKQNFPK